MRLKYKKPVALAITLIFAINSALFAAPELIFNNHPASRFSSAWAQKHIEIPESFGRINDSYFPDKSSPLIVHIRDAHGSYEAQKNIEKIIRYLNQNHGFNLLFLEGAASRLNPGIFNYGGNSEVNLKAADLLMRRGEFSGAENFLLKNPHQAAAFGIENVQDYRNSLRLYRSILNKLKESQKMIDDLEKDLDTKISRQASKPLQKFIRQWNQYKKGKSSLLSFSETILRNTEKYLNMDLTNAAIQFKYPNLLRVLKLKALESQLDLKKAAEEQMAISEQLDSPLNERVRNLETEKFPRYLLEQIKIDYKKYPEFTRLARYRIYKSEIDGISLHQELQSVIDQLLMKFAEKSAEKDLVHQIRLTDLLEKALKGELTREEFLTLRNQKVSAGASEQNIKNALSFYHSALRREASFLDKTIRGMAENKKSKAIIVAGGFHSEGIKQELKERGISYIEIQPAVRETEESSRIYHDSILGKPIEFGSSHISNVLQLIPLEEQKELGADTGIRQAAILKAVRLARAASMGEEEELKQEIVTELSDPNKIVIPAEKNNKTLRLVLKSLVSVFLISGFAGIIYGTEFRPALIGFMGKHWANIFLFGIFTVMNDLFGQWISEKGIKIKQVVWAFPLGLVLGVVTWVGFELTDLLFPQDISIPVLLADTFRVLTIWIMIRARTMLYALMVNKVNKNKQSLEEQEKQFESFWMTRSFSFIKNYFILKFVPVHYQTVAEGILNQYFQLFYSWSVNKKGFIFKSPEQHRNRRFLMLAPIAVPILWARKLIARSNAQPKDLMTGASLGAPQDFDKTEFLREIQSYLDFLSMDGTFGLDDQKPDAFLVLGNPDVLSFIFFARLWIRLGEAIPIYISGGRGRGTPGLISRIMEHYRNDLSEFEKRVINQPDISEARIIQWLLVHEGVLPEFITLEEKSTNTLQNFTSSIRLLETKYSPESPVRIQLVTSPALNLRAHQTGIRLLKFGDDYKWKLITKPVYRIVATEQAPKLLVRNLEFVLGYPESYMPGYPFNRKSEIERIAEYGTKPEPDVEIIDFSRIYWTPDRVRELREHSFSSYLVFAGADSLGEEPDGRLKNFYERNKRELIIAGLMAVGFLIAGIVPKLFYSLRPLSPTFYLHEFLHGPWSWNVENVDVPDWSRTYIINFPPVHFLLKLMESIAHAAARMVGETASSILPDFVDLVLGTAALRTAQKIKEWDLTDSKWKRAWNSISAFLFSVAFGYFTFHALYILHDSFHIGNFGLAHHPETGDYRDFTNELLGPGNASLVTFFVGLAVFSLAFLTTDLIRITGRHIINRTKNFRTKTNPLPAEEISPSSLELNEEAKSEELDAKSLGSLAIQRNPASILRIARNITENILFLPEADQTELQWYWNQITASGNEERAAQIHPSVELFNRNPDLFISQFGSFLPNPVPLVIFDGVIDPKDTKSIKAVMQPGDLLISVWNGKQKPDYVSQLYRDTDKHFKVRDFQKVRFSRSRLVQYSKPLNSTAVLVSNTSSDQTIEAGDNVKLNLQVLLDSGIDPMNILALIRTLSGQPELRGQFFTRAGFQFVPDKNYWEIGNKFLKWIESVYKTHLAGQAIQTAA